MILQINSTFKVPGKKYLRFGFDPELYTELFSDEITYLGVFRSTGKDNEYIFRIDEIERRDWKQTGNIRSLSFSKSADKDLILKALTSDYNLSDSDYVIIQS